MKHFLENYNGEDYYLYTISNNDLEISVSEYGATLCNFKYHGLDIVQGFENVHSYIDDVRYMNATIGRVCNRIEKGRFILNNKEYHVPINNGPNSLHGGNKAFDTRHWKIKEEDNKLICHYLSKDGEEGYPGNLDVEVVYELLDDGLKYSYRGQSDEDTLLNICNHAFFNINGVTSDSILDDYLFINADYIGMVDSDGCTHNEVLEVSNTPFDFRKRKKIGQDIDIRHEQIVNANGYDHHYIIKGEGFRHFCTYDNNKLELEVYSDLPGMHLYSSNFLEGNSKGKMNATYPRRSAICFETQYYPNAINCKDHKKPILLKDEKMYHETLFIIREMN